MSAGGVCVCKSVSSVCLLPEALAEMPRLTGRAKHQSCWASAAVQSRGGRAGGHHQLRRGCWEATGQTTSESPRQVTSAPALPLGVLTRGQGTCPPSLARAQAASRRRPKLRRCLVYLKDRSFLPQPFPSPAESLWQDPFPLWHGNSRLGSGLRVCPAGLEDSWPFPEACPGGPRCGPGGAAHRTRLATSGRERLCWSDTGPPTPCGRTARLLPALPPLTHGTRKEAPGSPGIASDTPQGPTGTADPPTDRPQCPTWSLRFVSNSTQHGKHSRA